MFFPAALLATPQTIYPTADTRITRGHHDRDDGWNGRLEVQKFEGGHGKLKSIINFPLDTLTGANIASAQLAFRHVQAPNGFTPGDEHGVRRMLNTSWIEGNRKSDDLDCDPQHPGSGPGMTWHCFIAADISADKATCPDSDVWLGAQVFFRDFFVPNISDIATWLGAQVGTSPGSKFVSSNFTDVKPLPNGTGWQNETVTFDVTADVRAALAEGAAVAGWMVERSNPGTGRIWLASRE